MPTTRRSAVPAVTATPRRPCCSTGRRTSVSASSSPPVAADEVVLQRIVKLVSLHDGPIAPQELRKAAHVSADAADHCRQPARGSRGADRRRDGLLALADDAPQPAGGAAAAAQVARSAPGGRTSRVEMVRGYAETVGCRRQFLLALLRRGHRTDVRQLRQRARRARRRRCAGTAWQVNDRVEHDDWGPGVVMRCEPDRVTVLFEQVGYKTLKLDAVHAGMTVPRDCRRHRRRPGGSELRRRGSARYRRDVVVVDSARLPRQGRRAISRLSCAETRSDRWSSCKRHASSCCAYRTVRLPDRARVEAAERVATARSRCASPTVRAVCALRVVLATGVVDACPDLEGFADHYGASAFHCPACDGHEAEGRDVVAYGWDERLVGFAASLLNWAKSVTVLTSGHRFDGDDACLRRARIATTSSWSRRRRSGCSGSAAQLEGVELADGRRAPGVAVLLLRRPQAAGRAGRRSSAAGSTTTDTSQIDGNGADDRGRRLCGRRRRTRPAARPGRRGQGVVAGVAAALSLHGEPRLPAVAAGLPRTRPARSSRPGPDGQ